MEAETQIQPDTLPGKGIPWWVILLAVLGGLLLLGLLAYGLHKVRKYVIFNAPHIFARWILKFMCIYPTLCSQSCLNARIHINWQFTCI